MSDSTYMKRALVLAKRGQGWVEPNPMVGCVIVKKDVVIGEGYHRIFGGPHAEVEALSVVKGKGARGAVVYVTLEPCSHHGKTGPCAEALIEAGVGRVVVGCVDPNPEVAGRGIKKLKRAGVKVEVCGGEAGVAAAGLIEPFAKVQTEGLPWVVGKWASTLDGAIATRTGDSQWISNEQSRRWVHQLRGRVDAVVTGIGTVLADDPLMTARGVRLKRIARRVVVDPRLRIPLDGKLVGSVEVAPLTIATAKGGGAKRKATQLRKRGVEIIELPVIKNKRGSGGSGGGGGGGGGKKVLNLKPLMRHLVKAHGATNVLLEGGPGVMGSMMAQDLVDELAVFIGPKLLGDANHIAPVVWPGADGVVKQMAKTRELSLESVQKMGGDLLLKYRCK